MSKLDIPTTSRTAVFSGFWAFIILIIDNNEGVDLLDMLIQYVGKQ